MNDLLIEIGCEDLPASFVKPLAEALRKTVQERLKEHGLLGDVDVGGAGGQAFATPRRVAVLFKEVIARAKDRSVERKGPKLAAALKDGQPTPAGLGFAKSCGVEFSKLAQEDGQLVFRQKQKGRKTVELIPEIFEEALKAMDTLVPKRMRWGSGDETFVRPVEWLVALYGNTLIPLERFGLIAGKVSYGHRFHAPKAIRLKSPADYEPALKDAKVWADFASRRDYIKSQIESEAVKLGGTPKIDEALLDEVTALVEWPVVISGCIEEKFLELPPEVIVATVETNQRYFTVFDSAGKLLPSFITIANIESKDVSQIVAGNERVVRPRLSDALFFWQQDLKQPLEAFNAKLSAVTYQKQLGSVSQKALRIREVVKSAFEQLYPESALSATSGAPEWADLTGSAFHAAHLCKADLATKMVYEFPELQGLMGGYYAVKAGKSKAISTAIAEHYRPIQAGGPIPSTLEGQIIALADKLDTLAGIFAIGQKPTASKDPYALRRAALGVLRICIEGGLDFDLKSLAQAALEAQPTGKKDHATALDLWNFLVERLRGYALDRGITAEQFEAVRATEVTRPLDFEKRLQALRAFAGSDAAASLAAADKRARNLLKQAGSTATATIEPSKFDHTAERDLAAALDEVEAALTAARARADYVAMLEEVAKLKTPVDRFFENVMVMAEDPAVRANRLALLARLDGLCREVADLSLLPG